MYLKSALLNEHQKAILRKALMLYISNAHRKRFQRTMSADELTVTLEAVDDLSELLHLKQVE